jgi:hypothetical protein
MGRGLSPEMRRVLGYSRKRPAGTPDGVDVLMRDAIEMAYPELRYGRDEQGQPPPPGSECWPGVDDAVLNRARAGMSRSWRRMEQRGLAVRCRGHRWAGLNLTELGRLQAMRSHWYACDEAKDLGLKYWPTAEKLTFRRECLIQEVMTAVPCGREAAMAVLAVWKPDPDGDEEFDAGPYRCKLAELHDHHGYKYWVCPCMDANRGVTACQAESAAPATS